MQIIFITIIKENKLQIELEKKMCVSVGIAYLHVMCPIKKKSALFKIAEENKTSVDIESEGKITLLIVLVRL